jgi:hypothetical protein
MRESGAVADAEEWSGFVVEFGFFDGHIFEFTGLEDFAAFETLHEFCIFLAGDNLHARVLTLCHGGFSRELDWVGGHNPVCYFRPERARLSPELAVFLALPGHLSSAERELSIPGLLGGRAS